jgi:hypothetical protein
VRPEASGGGSSLGGGDEIDFDHEVVVADHSHALLMPAADARVGSLVLQLRRLRSQVQRF